MKYLVARLMELPLFVMIIAFVLVAVTVGMMLHFMWDGE